MRKICRYIFSGKRPRCTITVSLAVLASLMLGKAGIFLSFSEHFLPPNLFFLIHGFAPLIGALIINIILAHLLFRLVCHVEEELSIDDDASVPKRNKQHAWHSIGINPVTFVTRYLSRTEHSPPAVSLLLI